MKHYFILFALLLFFINAFSQDKLQTLVKTSEYDKSGKKRRDIYLDSSFIVVKEEYYHEESQKIIFKIEYSTKNQIKKIVGFGESQKAYEIDYLKGNYEDFENNISLKFNGNFIFNGIQKSKNLVVNYRNGKKEGRLIQADSAVTSQKAVGVKKVDPRYLQFNIVKFYNSVELEPVYSIYNGLILNFQDGKLNGDQSSYYVDGKIKFKANLISDKLIRYTSFDKSNSIISKLETDSGITSKAQILNGQILSSDNQYIFWLNELSETGDIVSKGTFYDGNLFEDEIKGVYYGTESLGGQDLRRFMTDSYVKKGNLTADIFEVKKKFDEAKFTISSSEAIRIILGVPRFLIKQFSYQTNEDALITKVKLINSDQKNKNISSDTVDLSYGYYFLKSPLPYYQYRLNGIASRFLILPHDINELEEAKWISSENNERQELFKKNDRLSKWIKSTFNVSPSNFYFIEGDNEEVYYFNTSYLNNFLKNMVQFVVDKIEGEEQSSFNNTTNSSNFSKLNGIGKYIKMNRYFSLYTNESFLTIQNKNGSNVIKIYPKGIFSNYNIEVIKNNKIQFFELPQEVGESY
jgi:hypothetical protein